MVGELISLPVRLGLRTASIAIRGSLYATEQAFALAGQLAKVLAPHERESTPHERDSTPPKPKRDGASASPPADPAPRRPAPEHPDTADAEWEPTPIAPAHVSEEPELVEAFAEPGAEDGAGAELRIDEPWHGYGKLTATDVITHVAAADAEELAAVQLYEATHRKRETVLSAVERALRIATADRSGADDTTTKEH